MSADVAKMLDAYGTLGVLRIQQALESVNATGKTIKSVTHAVESDDTSDTLHIYARQWIELLEKGRGPTSKNPSPDMIRLLTEYAKARGMDKPESAAWAMAKSMNKKGDKTYQQGGRIVYSQVVAKLVEELKGAVKKEVFKGFRARIKTAFK